MTADEKQIMVKLDIISRWYISCYLDKLRDLISVGGRGYRFTIQAPDPGPCNLIPKINIMELYYTRIVCEEAAYNN
jgi:hypothetical protein